MECSHRTREQLYCVWDSACNFYNEETEECEYEEECDCLRTEIIGVGPMKVYLAGQVDSNWRNQVQEEAQAYEFFCPSTELTNPQNYTAYDVIGLKSCDIVFAFMEDSNPSGYGLCCEIGYAKGRNRTVIFVDADPERKNFAFIREMSDFYFTSIEDAVVFMMSKFKDIETMERY